MTASRESSSIRSCSDGCRRARSSAAPARDAPRPTLPPAALRATRSVSSAASGSSASSMMAGHRLGLEVLGVQRAGDRGVQLPAAGQRDVVVHGLPHEGMPERQQVAAGPLGRDEQPAARHLLAGSGGIDRGGLQEQVHAEARSERRRRLQHGEIVGVEARHSFPRRRADDVGDSTRVVAGEGQELLDQQGDAGAPAGDPFDRRDRQRRNDRPDHGADVRVAEPPERQGEHIGITLQFRQPGAGVDRDIPVADCHHEDERYVPHSPCGVHDESPGGGISPVEILQEPHGRPVDRRLLYDVEQGLVHDGSVHQRAGDRPLAGQLGNHRGQRLGPASRRRPERGLRPSRRRAGNRPARSGTCRRRPDPPDR